MTALRQTRAEEITMGREIINETFTLQVPDGFEVLTDNALRSMYRNAGDPFR